MFVLFLVVSVVCCLVCVLFDGCCLLYVVGCMSSFVSWRCLLFVQVVRVFGVLCVVRCLLFVVVVSVVYCSLQVFRCVSFVLYRLARCVYRLVCVVC